MTLLAVLLWVHGASIRHDAMEEGALGSGGKGVESRKVRFFVSLTMISRLNMNHALCASPYWPTDEPDGRLGHDRTSRNKVNAWLDMAMSRNVEHAGAEILLAAWVYCEDWMETAGTHWRQGRHPAANG